MLLKELITTKDWFDLIRFRVLPVAFIETCLLGITLLLWEPFPTAAGIAIIALSPIVYFWPLACQRSQIFHRYLLETAVTIAVILLAALIGALHIRFLLLDKTWTVLIALASLAAVTHQFILYRIRVGRRLDGLRLESALNWYLLAIKDQPEEIIADQLKAFYYLSESVTKNGLFFSRNHMPGFERLYQEYLCKLTFLEAAWTDRRPQWMSTKSSND